MMDSHYGKNPVLGEDRTGHNVTGTQDDISPRNDVSFEENVISQNQENNVISQNQGEYVISQIRDK